MYNFFLTSIPQVDFNKDDEAYANLLIEYHRFYSEEPVMH
jgi:hypothetical protein